MIRVHVTKDDYDRNVVDTIQVIGHAGDMACSAVSVTFHAALLGFRWIAENYPDEVLLFEKNVRPPEPPVPIEDYSI